MRGMGAAHLGFLPFPPVSQGGIHTIIGQMDDALTKMQLTAFALAVEWRVLDLPLISSNSLGSLPTTLLLPPGQYCEELT